VNVYAVEAAAHSYGGRVALRDVTFSVESGELVGIGGRNGAGKSTLIRILAGLLGGFTGEVSFQGMPIRAWKRGSLARRIAYVGQQLEVPFPYRAAEVVLMGRLPHQRSHLFDGVEDVRIACECLESVGASHLAERPFGELSGGERQLVVLASALAQQPDVLLLDEPTAFLDLSHRLRFTRLLRTLCDGHGLTVVLVTHDVELAAAFCDRVLLMNAGRLLYDLRRQEAGGVPLRGDVIASVFDLAPDELPIRLVYS
jgi:iron complex transport system ATP-binding protein